ncbi:MULTISPECIES: hypothetical protein [Fischerella]|nr:MULTISPECIES: hypothetical protein [Fischerella]MBD2432779.1 hypothetical protein [Fischerella sp. FACHB-380]
MDFRDDEDYVLWNEHRCTLMNSDVDAPKGGYLRKPLRVYGVGYTDGS